MTPDARRQARSPERSSYAHPVETKGEGGYCLAPPSPAKCHKRGRCYQFLGGKDLTMVQTITPEEREVLLDCARSLNKWKEKHRRKYRRKARVTGKRDARPGEDFNRRADLADVLEPHGRRWAGSSGEGDQWRRPGKGSGISATTNYAGTDLLYVFSTNADPFEDEKGYTKFSAYTLLAHDGDYRSAAAALARKGYGAKRRSSDASRRSFNRYASYKKRPRRPPK